MGTKTTHVRTIRQFALSRARIHGRSSRSAPRRVSVASLVAAATRSASHRSWGSATPDQGRHHTVALAKTERSSVRASGPSWSRSAKPTYTAVNGWRSQVTSALDSSVGA